jgi:membrane-bound lytic murein transglycosylase B
MIDSTRPGIVKKRGATWSGEWAILDGVAQRNRVTGLRFIRPRSAVPRQWPPADVTAPTAVPRPVDDPVPAPQQATPPTQGKPPPARTPTPPRTPTPQVDEPPPDEPSPRVDEFARDAPSPQVNAPAQDAPPAEVAAPTRVTVPPPVTEPTRFTARSRVAALPGAVRARVRGGLGAARLALTAWTRRAGVRLALATAMVLATVALSVFVGGYLTPALPLPTHRALAVLDPNATAGDNSDATGLPGGDGADPPAAVTPGDDTGTDGTATKPADLAPWAAPLAAKLAVPQPAMQAYGYAELAISAAQPDCQLRWTTLAGIGKVESGHGQAHATLAPNGTVLPPIIGAPLDGTSGRMTVHDTDGGTIDGDATWDHAVGPMQFIPSTWTLYAADADGDGVSDINNINDASLAAARYLCAANRNMSLSSDWWPAVLSYNAVQSYAQDVFDAANDYGARSR